MQELVIEPKKQEEPDIEVPEIEAQVEALMSRQPEVTDLPQEIKVVQENSGDQEAI